MTRPLPVPVAATAQRPAWAELPGEVRGAVAARLGSVVGAVSQGSGFTPGFASRLRLAGGGRRFVKAAGPEHPWLVDAYRTEAARLGVLPPAVPAPRLESVLEVPTADGSWLVLVLADVEGRPPARPWSTAEATHVLGAVTAMVHALTPAPPGEWEPFAATVGDGQALWAAVREQGLLPDLVDELAALAGQAAALWSGADTLVHGDLRDDNVILGTDGRVWVCDWNFPSVGPAWADPLCLAISCFGDGLDADALLAATGLVGPADTEAVDAALALLLGYFLHAGRQPPPDRSPYLRRHQAWYAAVVEDWLRARWGRPRP
jgi:Ser/Thr protein kinase RdoA (MazF antagonist)